MNAVDKFINQSTLNTFPMTVLNTTKLMSLFTALFLFLAVGCAEALETESNNNNNGGDSEADTTEGYFALPESPGDLYESDEFDFHVQTVVDGLSQPWAAAFLPEGLVLITERDGSIRKIKNGEMHSEPIAGVPEVFARNQGGLLDIEPHPNYEENGWLYMSYSKPNNGEGMTAIVRASSMKNHMRSQIWKSSMWERLSQAAGTILEAGLCLITMDICIFQLVIGERWTQLRI